MLSWGIFVGAFSVYGAIRGIVKNEPTWLYRWFRPKQGVGPGRFLRRARMALSRSNHLFMLPLLGPLVGYAVAWALLSLFAVPGVASFMLGMILGYVGGTVILYPIDISKNIAAYRERIAVFAARKLAQRMKPEESNAILVKLAQHGEPHLRLAAAMGLRELGTKEGTEALRLLGEDSDHRVAAAARDAFADLNQVYRGVGLLSVRTLDTYCTEHAYLLRHLGRRRKGGQWQTNRDKLAEVTSQIDEIVFSQLPLRRSFPDVYCEDCLARAEHKEYEAWEWVRCRKCKEVHGLRPGVRRVVGQVGGQHANVLADGTLHVQLWDEAGRKGRVADLDLLEVVGGADIHYDWAVAAIVGRFHEEGGQENRVKVKLTNAPPLEANSLQLLRSLDPSMIVE